MQVFIPYISPYYTALILDKKRLNKQIVECGQIMKAINGETKAWANHPATLMYKAEPLYSYLLAYTSCLKAVKASDLQKAKEYDAKAISHFNKLPVKLSEFMYKIAEQHKRRLYTKNENFYRLFYKYGKSDENWYLVNSQIIKYVNGKKLK